MSEKKINSRKLRLAVVLLFLVLIVCVAPVAGAFIVITNCPTTVNQGSIITITGDAPGIDTLKLTLNGLSIYRLNQATYYTTVNSDDSFSFSIDTSQLFEGQYEAVISPEKFEKGQSTTFDLKTKVAFSVLSLSSTPLPFNGYSAPSLTAKIDKTEVESGGTVTIDITTTGTSNIEYILIGQRYWEYNYFDTPDFSTTLNMETGDLPLGDYTVYIIHPKDNSYDVRADNNVLMFKGNYGSSFDSLFGKMGEDRIDYYLQQSNDLSKKLKFTVKEKETATNYTMVIVIFGIILGIVVVGGMIWWVIHGVRKQGRIQKKASVCENNTETKTVTKDASVIITESNCPTKKYCPHCGAEINDDYLFCKKCGTKIEPEETKVKCCPNCGAEVDDDYLFCLKCGTKIEPEETKVKCCPNCGAEVDDDYLFCLKCGKKL